MRNRSVIFYTDIKWYSWVHVRTQYILFKGSQFDFYILLISQSIVVLHLKHFLDKVFINQIVSFILPVQCLNEVTAIE